MRDHRSLNAWKSANKVLHLVIDFQENYWRPAARSVFEQIGRSALSVQINISEGYAFQSSKRFKYHLEVAYGSAVETSDLLEVLQVRRWAPGAEVDQAIAQCQTTQALLLGLIKSLRAA